MSVRRPNILLFLPHDLGDCLHCYGHGTVRSPRLDALAAEGIRLANYFAGAPECTPSRGCMYTGLHCHQNGLMGLSNFGWEIRPEVRHLARRLADGGYHTRLIGTQHETAQGPTYLGYETAETASTKVEVVCEGLRSLLTGDELPVDRPWFIQAGFHDVHRRWPTATRFTPDDMDVPPWLPDTPAIRQDLADFHDTILRMDTAIGAVLDTLAESGQEQDTLVIFTSDHGLPFPHAKATLYDPGLRIPLIMRWPAGLPRGQVHAPLLSNLDLTPTLIDLCGLEPDTTLAGRSFAPLLRGQPYAERDEIAATLYYDVAYDPMHAIRTQTHKYIRSFAADDAGKAGANAEVLATHCAGRWIRVDDFDVMSSPAWRSMKVDISPPPAEELYDLVADPHEQHNLAADPAAAPILAAMRQRLRQMMEATASPLLSGHVPPPEAQRQACQRYRPGGPMYANLP